MTDAVLFRDGADARDFVEVLLGTVSFSLHVQS